MGCTPPCSLGRGWAAETLGPLQAASHTRQPVPLQLFPSVAHQRQPMEARP